MKYILWVDLQSKHLSLTERHGFSKYTYDTEAGLQRVVKLLTADGYRMAAPTPQ